MLYFYCDAVFNECRMKTEKLSLTIESITGSDIRCCAGNASNSVRFSYNPVSRKLVFEDINGLSELICAYQFQFDKVIRSAIKGNFSVGQKINCVFIDGFNFLKEEDYFRFIRMDRRNGNIKITSEREESEDINKIYTDGSFAAQTKQSGYGGIIQYVDGRQEVYSRSFSGGGSNLMELLAVLDGLKRLQSIDRIQINTDSRFVIRGMVQWIHFWRNNDWQTAYGSKVKFADHWQQIDALSENKFIEFNWIKGHSGHLEQDFCHKLAQRSAKIL